MLTLVLAVAAFAAGVTGAWSPCGFSMVDTLAPHAYSERVRTTVLAGAVALAAAAGEARGARIVPQVRRQVPESWRRRMPLPLAAGLYGVLLGLGFTTFVLSFATYALAAACLAAGDPWVGAVVGLAFGAGRALPVILIAPRVDRPAGQRA